MESTICDNLKISKKEVWKSEVLNTISFYCKELYLQCFHSVGIIKGDEKEEWIKGFKQWVPIEVIESIVDETNDRKDISFTKESRFHDISDIVIKKEYLKAAIFRQEDEKKVYVLKVPESYENEQMTKEILIPIRKIKGRDEINEIRIFQVMESIYKIKTVRPVVKKPIIKSVGGLAIDLGIHNFASCLDTLTGNSFIIDGKPIKKIRHDYKETVRKKGRVDKKDRLEKERKMQEYIRLVCAFLVEYCLTQYVKTIVVGKNKEIDFQNGKSKKAKKIYIQQHYQFIAQLKLTCKKHGIRLRIVNEYATSKTDLLAYEDFPPVGKKQKYMGDRVQRGLFRSSSGDYINADINAAGNIGRKGGLLRKEQVKKISKMILKNPIRINPADLMKQKNLAFLIQKTIKEIAENQFLG